uniref:Transposase-associated domain-containing protein n=1 Tax=Oryza barthii TaxID=65489 RepID=A0A0D3GYD0_9ORYZ
MDLETIKILLRYPRGSVEYLAGVDGFLEFAYKDKLEDTKIYCPCETCVHTMLLSKNDVYDHLVCNGMLQSYDQWDFHGESSEEQIRNQQPQPHNEDMRANMHELINDALRTVYDDMPMSDSADSPCTHTDGPNLEAQAFYKLGGLDGASTNKKAICDDVPNSKRRRVYGDNPSQEICMFEEGNIMDQQDNSLMNTQSYVHDENLQPPTKHSTVYKNTQSLGQNHSGKQRKITSCANKRKGNLDQNELMQPGKSISSAYKVGTKLFLKSWKNRNTNVALATIVSCDPTRRVGGVELGNEFLMVHVDLALAKSEDLIRPYKGYKIVGHVVGLEIAWLAIFGGSSCSEGDKSIADGCLHGSVAEGDHRSAGGLLLENRNLKWCCSSAASDGRCGDAAWTGAAGEDQRAARRDIERRKDGFEEQGVR